MRKSTLQRATALLIGAGALLAATTTGASAAPVPGSGTKPAPIVHTMPKAKAAPKTAKSAPSATLAAAASPVAVVQPGQVLAPGDSVAAGSTTLVMQPDGNLVLYLVAGNGSRILPLWSSGTWWSPGARAEMQADGNFVIYRQDGNSSNQGSIWHSGTWGHPGAALVLAYGDLLIGAPDGDTVLWNARVGFIPAKVNGEYTENPSDTIGSNEALDANNWVESRTTILIMQADGNLVLYRKSDGQAIWSSHTWNHPGSYAHLEAGGVLYVADDNNLYWRTYTQNNPGAYAIAQDDGNFVIYRQGGNAWNNGALWSSGTWGKA
ncbi:hypothetical protein ACIA8O_07125 [Kitasatospora sp. NPDC051853]|uniref:hypothetical protein n=1 Tax=Kitasatospora sp. NPDC051853 TaxID=3364058 RepID=UPI0037B98410